MHPTNSPAADTSPATYALTEPLLQAIVATLNDLPAGRVRGLLNAIEASCMDQDKARATQALAVQRAALQAELSGGQPASADPLQ